MSATRGDDDMPARGGSHSAVDWNNVRADYERNDETLAVIRARYGIVQSALAKAVHSGGWRPRRPGRRLRDDRKDIIERLFRLLHSHIAQLETNMTTAGDAEAAVLGKLVATLDKLISLKDADSARRSTPKPDRQMSEIKARLAARIEQLKRG